MIMLLLLTNLPGRCEAQSATKSATNGGSATSISLIRVVNWD